MPLKQQLFLFEPPYPIVKESKHISCMLFSEEQVGEACSVSLRPPVSS